MWFLVLCLMYCNELLLNLLPRDIRIFVNTAFCLNLFFDLLKYSVAGSFSERRTDYWKHRETPRSFIDH